MSTPLFATPQPQQPQPLFQPQQPNPFQQSSPFSQQPQFQPQQQLFQPQQQQPQQLFQPQQQQQHQQQHQHQQQQLFLLTNGKTPASYGTKWADLHPDSQKFLLKIEDRILEYRDESQRLEQCSRLYDSSVSNEGLELDANHIVQELGGIGTAMERQKGQLQELMVVVKDMLRSTEVAIRSFMMLRPRFVHPNPGAAASTTTPSQAAGGSLAPGTSTSTSIVPVFDFYNGLPRKPSPFLQQTVSRFEKYLIECRQWVEELEQLLLSDFDRSSSNHSLLVLQSLPKVMSNVHDFFVHVAAKVESIHQYIESMKMAYLADHRRRGDGNDPFLEADRRETAKQEAAAKRVHPTLHLPAPLQPSSQVAGLFASSAAHAASSAPQSSLVVSSASSGSGFSLFSTPASSAASSSSSLFSTPAASGGASSLSGFGPSPQTSLFNASSALLFGASTTTSLFSSSTPSFNSTPASGTSLFSTPFATGAAAGSGASFGPTSKSSRQKSRTTRRP